MVSLGRNFGNDKKITIYLFIYAVYTVYSLKFAFLSVHLGYE